MAARTFTVYRLSFTAPLHIGNSRSDYGSSLQSVSSDSMYAAILATLAKMGATLPVSGDLGCTISSLFPYHKADNHYSYYFPRPLSATFQLPAEDLKKAKKQAYLPKEQFEQVLSGEPISILYPMPEFFISKVAARVRVPRLREGKAEPFYMDRLYFTDNAGLYFMVNGATDYIDKALPLLAEEGIGSDRNIGNGTFVYNKDKLSIHVPDANQYALLLSSYIPADAQELSHILDDKVAYELTRRGGWVTTAPYNTIRKNVIHMFVAGSVLHTLHMGDGKQVDLAPAGLVDHPIWRSGKAFVLPIKMQNDE